MTLQRHKYTHALADGNGVCQCGEIRGADCHQPSDEARRMSDTITMHILAGMAGHWAAIKLMDGSSDGIAYPTRRDAIKHQVHESFCCYIKIPPDKMEAIEADHLLRFYRKIRDAGLHMVDPESEREPIIPDRVDAIKDAEAFLDRVIQARKG